MQTTTAAIWNGWAFRWKSHPHRLSVLTSQLTSKKDHVEIASRANVGGFKDKGKLINYFSIIETQNVFIGYTKYETHIEIPRGAHYQNAKRLVIPLNDLTNNTPFENFDFPPQSEAYALLNGFDLQSVNNTAGWHFGALGLQILNCTFDKEKQTIVIDVEYLVRPGEPKHGLVDDNSNRDWTPEMPCCYYLEINLAVLIGSPQDIYASPETNHFQQENVVAVQTGIFNTLEFNSEKFTEGFIGISGFRMEIVDSKNPIKGRFLRGIGVFLDEVSCSDIYGLLGGKTNILLSNRGIFPSKWDLKAHVNTTHFLFKKGHVKNISNAVNIEGVGNDPKVPKLLEKIYFKGPLRQPQKESL